MLHSVRCRLLLESCLKLLVLALLASSSLKAASCGDVDASDRVDISDAVYLVNYIFAGGGAPQDDAAGDLDCSGQFDISDAVLLVNYIFGSGPAPCNGPLCEVGVLLPGDEDSLAVSVLYDYGPIAADSAAVGGNGFLKTRLTALIHPQATIGAVNAALSAIGGTLTWITAGDLMVTVAFAPVGSAVQADSIANLLIQSGAFLYAHAAYSLQPDAVAEFSELPPTGTSEIEHLVQMRMPAAWNVKARAASVNSPATVLVPDNYRNLVPHAEIPSQIFISSRGKPTPAPTGSANHGFMTSGVIGAQHDNINTTGTHPGPTSLLSIKSLLIGRLTSAELLDNIADNLPAGRFVMNTSIGYVTNMATFGKLDRILEALAWRVMVWSRKDDFIHITSAGNEGDAPDDTRYAVYNSAFIMASAFGSPFDAFSPGEITLFESFVLQNYLNFKLLGSPFALTKLENVVVVGSSDSFGNESIFSNIGAPVRTLGEWIPAPCVLPDSPPETGGCEQSANGGLIAHPQGTSFACPQVAGLAAYLLNLDPTLSNSEIKDLIQKSYDESPYSGFVDGYLAVLMLDDNIFNAPIRLTLLDVAHAPGVAGADGFFDEFDIQYLLDKFTEYELIRLGVPNAPADHSRFDLNGDGFTGGVDKLTKFDLDINHPPAFTSFSQQVGNKTRQFDELQISDLEILCYYSNTPMFSGTEAVRDSLLVDCPACDSVAKDAVCPNLWVIEADFPTFIQSSAPLHVRVGQQSDSGIVWRDGVEVQLLASGGSVAPAAGTTGVGGIFGAVGTIADGASDITISVSAIEDSNVVAMTTVQALKMSTIIMVNVQHYSVIPGGNGLTEVSSTNFAPVSFSGIFNDPAASDAITALSQSQVSYQASVDYDLVQGTVTFTTEGAVSASSQAQVIIPTCGDEIGFSGNCSTASAFNQTIWQFKVEGPIDSLPFTMIINASGGASTTGAQGGFPLSALTYHATLSDRGATVASCEPPVPNQQFNCSDSISGYLIPSWRYDLNASCLAGSNAVLNPECATSAMASAQSSVKLIIELPEAVKRNRRGTMNH